MNGRFEDTDCIVRDLVSKNNDAELNHYSVQSLEGAVKLLQHCETICSSDSSLDLSVVTGAVENGTLRVDCCRAGAEMSSVDVTISLTEHAFEVCSADCLPLQRHKSAKKYHSATQLHRALAQLFPDSVIVDTVQAQKAKPITAKTVYDLIDNVKLQEYEQNGGYDSKPLSIPGLLPTLRPYQEAAVRWMLRREQCPSSENSEWELAWVVLSRVEQETELQATHDGDGMLFCTRDSVSLPEWKRRMKSNEIKSGLLFCPFVGFLVQSDTEAYMATLNSFLAHGDGAEWANATGGILAESMGLGKTVEVLACLLSNRHPMDRSPKPSTDLPSIEEEKKECNEEIDAVKLDYPARELIPVRKWVDHFGACVCGSASSFRGCLSTVICQSCHEPLHGICAGFKSLEELKSETSNEVMGCYIVPVCSSDRCPTCVFTRLNKTNTLIESRATLIVTPAAILSQWEREIRRHVGIQAQQNGVVDGSPIRTITSAEGLKVVIYPGIKEICNRGGVKTNGSIVSSSSGNLPPIHLIHPQLLADADIVLMTFDTLTHELGHSDDNPYVASSRRLRTEKRYRVLPSPLTSIKWWRVCLDEAQRVETPTATSAKMALKLTSHHRWCISGTPIGRGKLDDLYGLFSFLKLGPFSSKKWFQACLHPGHRGVEGRISHLLSSVIWRSTKASDSVKNQIGIPEQIEKTVLLKFSSIERHFYERQLESTLDVASDVMSKQRRSKHSDDLLASHIHQLRAACCHPQVGSRGIGRLRKSHKRISRGGDADLASASVSSSVLTMDQILDRLIDDARTKCEEAQRLAVMHTNALASIEKLKVDAKAFGVDSNQSDDYHLSKSSEIYLESLELTDSNALPSYTVGEATLSGCSGFLANNTVIRNGKARLEWKTREEIGIDFVHRELSSRIDYELAKKIVQIRARPVACQPQALSESEGIICLYPKDCVFQVSSAAVGGEFVDVVSFSFPDNGSVQDEEFEWLSFGSFHTNKSKSWRIVVKNYHEHKTVPLGEFQVFWVGLDLEMMEPDIAADSLQRLHVLHNASLSMSSLLEHFEREQGSEKDDRRCPSFMNVSEMKEKVKWMQDECQKIESLYMDAARGVHSESQRQLKIAMEHRKAAEDMLCSVSPHFKSRNSLIDFWKDEWWNDLLSLVYLNGSAHERSSLCDRVRRDLGDFTETLEGASYEHRSFPEFHDVDGIQLGLNLRFGSESLSCSHASSMQAVSTLSSHPSPGEVSNNAHCHKCRADWNQTGPECNHCKLETKLNELDSRDPVISVVLRSLHRWLLETRCTGKLGSRRKDMKIDKRADYFFDTLKASERELRVGRLAWRTHFDLLSDFDEMNQCKRTIRLAGEDEDLTKLTSDELGSIVAPWDIAARSMDHGAKQAMALATLRRSKDTLRYLKNQSNERQEERDHGEKSSDDTQSSESNVCVVCLSSFDGERAVLACGHSFHHSPCLERLMARSGNHQTISCPLRCTTRTKRDEVMIASDKRRDDGSRSNRKVIGSWGTKVTRLLSDIMEVSDRAEKGLVFSQWEDMLDVVEEALKANGIEYVRSKTLRKMGDCVKAFRSSRCSVFLLNVKNSAEGLTLVEACHVFMIEPLLNCGLDSQAINRIHRIGQRSKTYVHRYLIQDTIEEKIDKMRIESQDDQLEDALNESRKKHAISAGGIDGGFSHEQLQDILH